MKIRRAWKIRRATLTKTVICAMIESASPWSGIEVVITALTRNQVYRQRYRGFESHPLRQLNPHVLIQSMGISFCIYRLISCQNIDYNYPIWDISARSGLLGVILSDGSFHFPPFFSLLMAAFRGRNQRLIKKCTLLWTIAGYRPQCKVPSKVSQNSA
mgnify:CR=1 FL=1